MNACLFLELAYAVRVFESYAQDTVIQKAIFITVCLNQLLKIVRKYRARLTTTTFWLEKNYRFQ